MTNLIYEVLDDVFVSIIFLGYLGHFAYHARWQWKAFATVLVISLVILGILDPSRWRWKTICLWTLAVIEFESFSPPLEEFLGQLEGSLGTRWATWVPFLDEFWGLGWVRWMGPRWVRLMVFVEGPKAIASGILLLFQVDITALPLITTHIVALAIAVKYIGRMRSAAKQLKHLKRMHSAVSVDTIRCGMVERLRRERKKVMRFLFITVFAVVVSIGLFFVSALGIYHHVMSLQAGLSALVMLKGHLRKHFLELRKKLHKKPNGIKLPLFQGTADGSATSTTCLVSPASVHIAK
ncbi:hypothetical protein AUP68_06431 [Ilyonectria robusta]